MTVPERPRQIIAARESGGRRDFLDGPRTGAQQFTDLLVAQHGNFLLHGAAYVLGEGFEHPPLTQPGMGSYGSD